MDLSNLICILVATMWPPSASQMLFWLVTQSFLVGEERLGDESKERLQGRLA